MADDRQYLTIDGTFGMVRGQITDPVIAYETWGTLNERADNAVLIFTGLSPSAHVASSPTDPSTGWWEDMVGPGKPIDTRRYFVVCYNSLGSCFGSTGPASINPETGEKYRLDFPVLCIEDIAKAGNYLLAELGIEVVDTLVGSSMGGMTALAHSAAVPRNGAPSAVLFLGYQVPTIFHRVAVAAARIDSEGPQMAEREVSR